MGLFSSEPAAATAPKRPPTLEEIYKSLLSQKDKGDINALTSQLAYAILAHSIQEGASDAHFDPHGDTIAVRFRVDGDLRDRLTFSKKDFPVTSQLRVMAGFSPQSATAYTPEDGAFSIMIGNRSVRFRASAFPTIYGDKLVIRLLDTGQNALNLDLLGFSPEDLAALKSAISSPSGIFFVCGITGGGKTTTLCSILNAVNRPQINIMTLEDPVEYQLPRVIQSIINPKAGFGFADGLRCILRQDPNIIMVGEVRDLETAEIAMRAALTGHLIFSSIHTISATGVVTRLIDMGIPPFLITEAMIGSLAQRLVRKVCPACAEPAAPDAKTVETILSSLAPADAKSVLALLTAQGGKFTRGRGCPACQNTGYKGRIGVFEILSLSKPLRELLSAKTSLAELRRAAISAGMSTLVMDAARKAWSGVTTIDEVGKVTSEV